MPLLDDITTSEQHKTNALKYYRSIMVVHHGSPFNDHFTLSTLAQYYKPVHPIIETSPDGMAHLLAVRLQEVKSTLQ